MTLHTITVYHNTGSPFTTYTSGDTLREVISHCCELPEITKPEPIAQWLFGVLNADLEFLEQARENAGAESGFLLACTYRLLGFARFPSAMLSRSRSAITRRGWPAHRLAGAASCARISRRDGRW
jgi:hypothetical protein